MKNIFLILLSGILVLNMSSNLFAGLGSSDNISGKEPRFFLTINAGMRSVQESRFQDIYGSSQIVFGLDVAARIFKSVEVFLHTDYLKADGDLSYEPTETKFTIMPIEIGLRVLLGKGKIKAYLGAGGGYYKFKEENFIGTIDSNKFSGFVEGGLRFFFARSFFADLKVKNVFLKVKPEDIEANLSGTAILAGLGLAF